jgi:protein-L-isoaspartate(D-aspartate) O-methyltransferase
MKPSMMILTVFFILSIRVFSGDAYSEPRERMVKRQIENRGIADKAVLTAMRKVQRHLFVPGSLEDRAYDDNPLPIGFGQTISQPYIVAFMTEIIDPKPESKVLEVGTGSGYHAAVMAETVASVYTIEIVRELAETAAKRLKGLGYKNVQVRNDDGYHGWKENGPYDAIVVTAAAEYVPPPLIEQLKDGGKMIIPVGSPFLTQNLILVEKKDGKVTTRNILPVRFVPLTRRTDRQR